MKKSKFNKIVLIILDGCGIGVQPDYGDFHSNKTNTIGNLFKNSSSFSLPFLESAGLDMLLGKPKRISPRPNNYYCKLKEISSGNDTFVGLWEMFGLLFRRRFFSNGEGIAEFLPTLKLAGLETICNKYISGYIALDKYFSLHKETKKPIFYLSNDGVLLLAAHDSILSPKELNEFAEQMSTILYEKGFVRIITRPFTGKPGNFIRIEKYRRDFMLVKTPSKNMITELSRNGVKIRITKHLHRIFNKPSDVSVVDKSYSNNDDLFKIIRSDFQSGKYNLMIYVLPDTDNLGHKKDPDKFRTSLVKTDRWIKNFTESLEYSDLLIITADHGCDPSIKMRGHSREYIPLFAFSNKFCQNQSLGTRRTFADIGQTICRNFDTQTSVIGEELEIS